jgi:hypothetical protein
MVDEELHGRIWPRDDRLGRLDRSHGGRA